MAAGRSPCSAPAPGDPGSACVSHGGALLARPAFLPPAGLTPPISDSPTWLERGADVPKEDEGSDSLLRSAPRPPPRTGSRERNCTLSPSVPSKEAPACQGPGFRPTGCWSEGPARGWPRGHRLGREREAVRRAESGGAQAEAVRWPLVGGRARAVGAGVTGQLMTRSGSAVPRESGGHPFGTVTQGSQPQPSRPLPHRPARQPRGDSPPWTDPSCP